MKFFIPLLFLGAFITTAPTWETDFNKAQQKATAEHKYILLAFSGSDWCVPCIKLHKQIFESSQFTGFADSSLVLVNADFPRLKKNSLSKDQQKKNEVLADKYDPEGNFPYTLLLDQEGNVLKSWDGLPDLSPEQFTSQIKKAMDARK